MTVGYCALSSLYTVFIILLLTVHRIQDMPNCRHHFLVLHMFVVIMLLVTLGIAIT